MQQNPQNFKPARENKFRVWDGKQWSYFTLGQTWTGWMQSVYDDHCLNGRQFFQFTGLKDRNEKEIWEGDILKVEDPYRENAKTIVMEFKNGAYAIEWDNMFYEGADITTIVWASEMDFSFEVIGNIYENPELVTGAVAV